MKLFSLLPRRLSHFACNSPEKAEMDPLDMPWPDFPHCGKLPGPPVPRRRGARKRIVFRAGKGKV